MPPPTWQQLKILGVVLEDPDLGVEIELLGLEVHREPRDPRPRDLRHAALERQPRRRAVRVEAREVLHVDVARLQEVRRGGDAEQAVLELVVGLVRPLPALAAVAVHREHAGARHAAVDGPVEGLRVPHVNVAAADADVRVGVVEDPAQGRQARPARRARRRSPAVAAADVDHPAVRRDRQPVRLAAGGEAGLDRPAADHAGPTVVGVDRRLAVAAHEPGRPLDRAQQVGAEACLAVTVRRAAHAGEERPPAADVAAP